jgi:hypothetical protein
MKNLTGKLDEAFIGRNYDSLYKLFVFVKDKGGFYEAVGNDLFKKHEFWDEDEKLTSRDIFNKYLYHFQLFEKNKENDEKLAQICQYKPENIVECPIYSATVDDEPHTINDMITDAFKHDLVILRGLNTDHFRLDNSKFTLDYIEKYKNETIDVREQDPHFYGFTKNYHLQRLWQLTDYIKYAQDFDKLHKNDKKIYYAVNVDLGNYKELEKELETKISPLLVYGSKYDILAYVRKHIKGMTKPQMYIKVPGVWTGGHEENLRMRSININHGPGNSFWYAAYSEDSQKLFEKVQEQYQVSIYKKEGIWFPNIDFFLTGDIRIYYTVQKEGDIVLVGPGTIHW